MTVRFKSQKLFSKYHSHVGDQNLKTFQHENLIAPILIKVEKSSMSLAATCCSFNRLLILSCVYNFSLFFGSFSKAFLAAHATVGVTAVSQIISHKSHPVENF